MSSTPQPLISVPGQDGKAHTPTLEPAPISPWKKVQTRPPMPFTHHPPPPQTIVVPNTPPPSSQLRRSPGMGTLQLCAPHAQGHGGAHHHGRCRRLRKVWDLGNPVISIFTVELSHGPATHRIRVSLQRQRRGREGAEISGGAAASSRVFCIINSDAKDS